MKRSKHVKLLLLSAAIATISGCKEEAPQEVSVFQNITECVDSKLLTQDQCKAAFTSAIQEHQNNAPKYTNKELCEQEYGKGNCETKTASDGSNVFLPLMTGFMAARLLDDITDRQRDDYYYGGSGGFTPQPLYRSSKDYSTYRTSGNVKVGSVGAKTATVKPSTVTTSVSKSGGFGNQSAARASWGGSKGSFGG
jgi:uncharacterized protein YgiB involved in biofilm formation